MFTRAPRRPTSAAPATSTRTVAETEADLRAVVAVVQALSGAHDPESAINAALKAVRTHFGWAYGSYWQVRGTGSEAALHFAQETGDAGEEFRHVTLAASFRPGVGLSGRAWASRDLVFVPDIGEVADCVRAPAAQRAGVRSGICFPIFEDGQAVATIDFFTTSTLTPCEGRLGALRSVGVLVSQALERTREQHRQRRAAQDVEAVNTVLRELAGAQDAGAAVRAALGVIRAEFNWDYGSFWALDAAASPAPVLRFDCEVGSVNEEFRRVTASASFARGVGVAGRAWASRDVVFVEDLAQVTDCVRAPAAQRAGVRSGVCLPVVVGEEVVGRWTSSPPAPCRCQLAAAAPSPTPPSAGPGPRAHLRPAAPDRGRHRADDLDRGGGAQRAGGLGGRRARAPADGAGQRRGGRSGSRQR